jgi:regulator of sirC expression with transglutaminase-like and TPR domain
MKKKIGKLAVKLKTATGQKAVSELLEGVETLILQDPRDTDLLQLRAEIYIKLQQPSKAINDYNKILSIDPKNPIASFQVEHLKTILKFNNTDIYANPNTNLDPWLD